LDKQDKIDKIDLFLIHVLSVDTVTENHVNAFSLALNTVDEPKFEHVPYFEQM